MGLSVDDVSKSLCAIVQFCLWIRSRTGSLGICYIRLGSSFIRRFVDPIDFSWGTILVLTHIISAKIRSKFELQVNSQILQKFADSLADSPSRPFAVSICQVEGNDSSASDSLLCCTSSPRIAAFPLVLFRVIVGLVCVILHCWGRFDLHFTGKAQPTTLYPIESRERMLFFVAEGVIERGSALAGSRFCGVD